jgi:hypothetical protein
MARYLTCAFLETDMELSGIGLKKSSFIKLRKALEKRRGVVEIVRNKRTDDRRDIGIAF